MKVERYEATRHGSTEVPPRTFVELSDAEVLEAVRRYCCDEGVDLPFGRPRLMSGDGSPRDAGFVLLVEQQPPEAPLFDAAG